MDITNLHKYQLRGIGLILDKKKCALYFIPGAGKTVISLTAIIRIIDKAKEKLKTLIIAPLLVAKEVWHNELLKWEHTKHLTYSHIIGNPQQRFKALTAKKDIYIINRENVLWLYKTGHVNWDIIIVDESSSFKNPRSQRFRSLKNFKYDYMVELSGTPSPNGLLDIWSQIFLLDKGKRLGKTFYEYQYRFFNPDYWGYNFTPKNPAMIYSKIEDIAFSLKPSDYVELPEKINLVTKVEITSLKKYKELEKEFILSIKNREIVALNSAALSNKLLQFCNGSVYDEHKNTIEIHDDKLNALEAFIEDNPDENIIVAYNYQSDLKRLEKRFKHAVVLNTKGDTIERWNERKIKLLLCHPASCGKGLNLQKGGNIIVWFGLTWNLEDYIQFNARLYRQGQEKPVIINHLVAKDCIDELVIERLMEKDVTQQGLLDYLLEKM